MKKSLLLALFIFSIVHISEGKTIQRLGLEQGLSNNYITRITQDKQGILWFATRSGLNRFDGREFRVFSMADSNTVSGNELNAVLADNKDNLVWIATARRGLNVFDCKTYRFTHFKHNQEDPNTLGFDGVTDLKNDSHGNLWIATYGGGVDYYDKKTKRFEHFNTSNVKGLVSNIVWSVSEDNNGNLYIAHVFDGLSVLSVKDRIARNYKHDPNVASSLPDNGVLCVLVDSKKNVWLGTVDGLALFNPVNGQFKVFRHVSGNPYSISDSYIECLTETRDGKLLIGTFKGGLNILDTKQLSTESAVEGIRFEHIGNGNLEHELSHPYVKSAFQDSYGNVWIGTFGGGINFYTERKLHFNSLKFNPTIGSYNNLSHRVANGLCVDKESKLWVATGGGGIDVFDGERKLSNYTSFDYHLLDNNILTAFTDSKGQQWFGSLDGHILVFDPKKGQFSEIKGFPTDRIEVRSFFEDNDKNIWIATNKGLHVFNLATSNKKSYYESLTGISDNVVRAVNQDNLGNIWVGTLSGQVCIFNKAFKRIRMISPNGHHEGINQIFRDRKNRMWVATGENLFLFNSWRDSKFKIFGTQQGLSDNFIEAVTEGEHGTMWCSTNSGISCLNMNNGSVKNFNHSDGVPLGNFMPGSVAKSNDGTIYFGSENGVCYFNDHQYIETKQLPPTIITDLAVSKIEDSYTGDLEYYPVQGKVKLKYNQNTFTISYNVPDYSIANQVEFSYMLEGLEGAWYNIKNTRQITFRNLPPGSYTFHVKSRFRNQDWGEEITSLSIDIQPPFWFSWWAKMIYTLLIIGLTLWFIRFYHKRIKLENSLLLEKQKNEQQQELNNERLKFYTNITHELRTPLTLIVGPLEDLIYDDQLQEKFKGKIHFIHKSAIRLLDLINQLLEFRKTEAQNRKLLVQRNNLEKQIQEITLKYVELNRNSKLEINCKIEQGNFDLLFDQEVITIVLDNLLSNAIKYTPEGKISVTLRQLVENQVNYTEIELRDTGYGIDAIHLPYIFDRYYQVKGKHQASGTGIGLSIVKNLIELHESEIRVESELNSGTTFYIRLITYNTYPDALHFDTRERFTDEQTDEQKPIILVVEDHADIRQYIVETFSEDYEVLTSENGQQGIDLAVLRIPDVILSDLMMPVMDGTEFCRRVKEDQRTSHIPFIMLTAKDTLQDKTDGYSAGADSYITKPFSGSLLKSRVSNLIESRKKMANRVINSLTKKEENSFSKSISPIDQGFLQKITTYIEDHLEDEEINIARIADQVSMSHSSLYRKIKALTGLSTNEFVRKIRMQNARKLIIMGGYNISQVMYMVGINSSTYFRKSFKDVYGMSPMEFLRTKKNSTS